VRAVLAQDLGAWLLKGNGDTSDIAERAAAGETIDRWCVQPSYRTELMRSGHPVVFWVAGSRRGLTAGIWALGELTGPPRLDPDGPHRKLRAPLRLRWLAPEERVSRAALRADPRLIDLEVLRQPMASNPSFVTVTQLDALRDHLPRPAPHGRRL
jgi:hypothetical protein